MKRYAKMKRARMNKYAQQNILSVAENAEYIAKRIRGVLAETGAEKININTPHRGCEFADFMSAVRDLTE